MKTLFNILDDITYLKPKYELLPSDEFSPYMIQRYLSMISPEYNELINIAFNDKVIESLDRQMLYDFLKCLIPKKNCGRIKYIKRTDYDKKSEENEVCSQIAKSMELSKREVKMMLDIIPDLFKNMKDSELKQYKKIDIDLK